MFSESTAKIITSLKFDPGAEIVSCLLPLGSIFWTDLWGSLLSPRPWIAMP
jgi:hypothetical protein